MEKILKRLWFSVSIVSLLLPLIAYSMPEFVNVMNVTIIAMLVLTLPISFLASVLFVGLRFVLEMYPDSLFNTYFYLVLINILGYLQWFWIAPKFFGAPKEFRLPTILDEAGH